MRRVKVVVLAGALGVIGVAVGYLATGEHEFFVGRQSATAGAQELADQSTSADEGQVSDGLLSSDDLHALRLGVVDAEIGFQSRVIGFLTKSGVDTLQRLPVNALDDLVSAQIDPFLGRAESKVKDLVGRGARFDSHARPQLLKYESKLVQYQEQISALYGGYYVLCLPRDVEAVEAVVYRAFPAACVIRMGPVRAVEGDPAYVLVILDQSEGSAFGRSRSAYYESVKRIDPKGK